MANIKCELSAAYKGPNEFRFDMAYYHVKHRYNKIYSHFNGTTDQLVRFTLQGELDIVKAELETAELVLEQNVDKLFNCCKKVGIKRIFIGDGELVTNDVRYGSWPAIWAVVDMCATDHFKSGCGNGNQSQVHNVLYFIPKKYINRAWDVKSREQIDVDPFLGSMVVTNFNIKKPGF